MNFFFKTFSVILSEYEAGIPVSYVMHPNLAQNLQ